MAAEIPLFGNYVFSFSIRLPRLTVKELKICYGTTFDNFLTVSQNVKQIKLNNHDKRKV